MRPQCAVHDNVDLYRRTLSFESYASLIRCPVLHRSSTNDFHGWMDDVYRTLARIQGHPLRYSWSPHLNHHLLPSVAVTMPLWFDHFLKDGPALPETPESSLKLGTLPELHVAPASHAWPVIRCEIYYSIDDEPCARFWRSADVTRLDDGRFVGRLPLHSDESPLIAFANVYHALPEPVDLSAIPGYHRPATEICVSNLLHHRIAADLRAAGPRPSLSPGLWIDDFSRGMRDWYVKNEGHPGLQQLWTRKITDPLWRGPAGARLAITLRLEKTNHLCVILEQNEWRSYRGPRRTYIASSEIPGGAEAQTLILAPADFTCDGKTLENWSEIDQLGIGGTPDAPRKWEGTAPEILSLEWR